MAMQRIMEVGSGICECGCGEETGIYGTSVARLGIVKGISRYKYKLNHRKRFTRGAADGILYSDCDKHLIEKYYWRIDPRGYAYSYFDGKFHKLHRVIMQPPVGLSVDHINGNKLNNRRENLRVVDHQTNMQNLHKRDKQPGFCYRRQSGKWEAYAALNLERVSLGMYDNREDAIRVAHEFRVKHYAGYTAKEPIF